MREGTQFYRCTLCTTVVSPWDVKSGAGCQKCGCLRIKPTNLSWWESVMQIIRHPSLLRMDENL